MFFLVVFHLKIIESMIPQPLFGGLSKDTSTTIGDIHLVNAT